MSLPLYQHDDLSPILRRMDITDYVRDFILDLTQIEGYSVKLNNEIDAIRVKGLLDDPGRTSFKSIKPLTQGLTGWDSQEVIFVKSNLGYGHGYLFYFICNGCRKRVKYLYEQDPLRSPFCRTCCRISYTRKRKRNSRKMLRSIYDTKASSEPFHIGYF
jgi:hypothetical protein